MLSASTKQHKNEGKIYIQARVHNSNLDHRELHKLYCMNVDRFCFVLAKKKDTIRVAIFVYCLRIIHWKS